MKQMFDEGNRGEGCGGSAWESNNVSYTCIVDTLQQYTILPTDKKHLQSSWKTVYWKYAERLEALYPRFRTVAAPQSPL